VSIQTCIPSFRLGLTLCLYLLNCCFENVVASLDTSVLIIKYNFISVIPNAPTASHHGYFEEWVSLSVRSIQEHVNHELEICVLLDVYD
jgi:hypothetical protein